MQQNNDDIRFMRLALEEAQLAYEADEVPVGCIVACRGQIVGRGHNLAETLSDVTAHAEMQAITAAMQTLGSKYLTDCTLYVTVEPCAMCAGAIGWAQVGRVVYGAADAKRGYSVFAPKVLHPKCKVQSGLLEEDCAALMTQFFKNKRK